MGSDLACPPRSGGTQQVQTWRDDFDRTWSWDILPVRSAWLARASAFDVPCDCKRGCKTCAGTGRVRLSESQRAYAGRRASSLAGSYFARQDACERTGSPTRCGCRVPGRAQEAFPARDEWTRATKPREGVAWHSCRRHLTCDRCRRSRSNREGTRIRTALANHVERLPRGYHVVMVTVGLRHSGDVRADRVELSESWRRFRDSYAHRFGRFPFVGVFEVTPGEDKLGHVHAHVLCVWPIGRKGSGSGGDWQLLREIWVKAARGRSEVIFFSRVKRCGDAAGYVAKYVAKGVASDEFSPELAAHVASATYNTRFVFTSRFFWLKWERRCTSCGAKVVNATFRWSRVEDPPSPPPSDWSTGPPSGCGYQQASFALPEPHQCGSSSRD